MTDQAELEISLNCLGKNQFEVRMRYSQPHSDADIELMPGRSLSIQFDPDQLNKFWFEQDEYGRLLGENLFTQPDVRTAFAMATSSAASAMVELRLRLLISPDACWLHSLRWETLHDPLNPDQRLTTDQNLWFSRYVPSRDWCMVKLRPRQDLRALVLIANPDNLVEYKMTPVDVPQELDSIKQALGEAIPYTSLAERGKVTVENLFNELQHGYDILVIIAHGTISSNQTYLWLEDAAGHVARLDGDTFLRRLHELQERPRLILLVSCNSAGKDEAKQSESALYALGPRLAEEGIPAVLAMHGNITMLTARSFLKAFFSQLRDHGQIDRAAAVARSQIQDRSDWWVPVLYLRLKSGQINWYDPGFTGDESLRKWPSLIASIRDHECTPIVGPGLAESIFGSRRQLARQWAKDHNFPMAPHNREGLPQVSQYLAVNQDSRFTRRSLVRYFCQEIRQRQWNLIPPEIQNIDLDNLSRGDLMQLLNQMMSEVWQHQSNDSDQPYRVLASLNLPIYLSSDPTDLLLHALRAAKKDPHIQICPWNDYTEQLARQASSQGKYVPSPQEPLVYYMFGRLDEPESLVMTEDEYFNYLIRTAQNHQLISDDVRAALVDTSLLFMGFDFDDWDFRVLLRVLMSQEGQLRRSNTAHIATQIAPRPDNSLLPIKAKEYLDEYFRGASIYIFWGMPRDFVRELDRRWRGAQ